MGTKYTCKVEYPFNWKPDEQGRDLFSAVCGCHFGNHGHEGNFQLKIEIQGMLKQSWEKEYGTNGFVKLVHWIIRDYLTKMGFPPKREKSGFVEIPPITFDLYKEIPCVPDEIDIVPGEPFNVEIPDPPFGFHSKKDRA